MATSQADWQDIRKRATDFVAAESPPSVWPFERRPRDALRKAARKVFAHYFPPFPLSIDGRNAADDYYTTQFLRRNGENNKYSKVGGYLRERPLPVPAWGSVHWQEINLAIEILRADLIGLDGFGADLLTFDGQIWKRTQMLYDAAAAVAPEFRIVAEPDMASLRDVTETELVTALAALLARPSAYRLPDGRYLVVPFSAESKTPEFWQKVSADLAHRHMPVALMPDFLDPAGKASYVPMSYGFTYWGPRDPVAAAAHPMASALSNYRNSTDFAFMAPVAPQDERPKDAVFWEAHNSTLFRTLWMQAITSPAQYVHLITWNDYSEASEISPSTGTQFIFYDLAAYYTEWFKLGHAPAVGRDAIFFSHRRQIMEPWTQFQPGDLPFKLKGLTNLTNDIEVIVFLKEDATIEIETGSQTVEKQVKKGINFIYSSARPGTAVFRIKRASAIALEKLSDWPITGAAECQDPLYVGGSTTRAFIPFALERR